jgi:hypothetical protein
MICLTDHEIAILLGATLMHWGVPFHFSTKRPLSAPQQKIVDEASEKLIALRSPPSSQPREVNLSDSEIALLAEVADNCIEECGNNAVDLRLHLAANNRREVEMLIARLRRSIAA